MVCNRFIKFCLVLFLASQAAFAQQDPQFSQYMFNSHYFNPGSVGIDGMTSATLFVRDQWTGLKADNGSSQVGPKTQMLSIATKLYKLNSGIGGYVINDAIGSSNVLAGMFSYAYHFNVGGGKLGFGARLGFANQRLYSGDFIANQQGDPRLQGDFNETKLNTSAGAFFTKDKYYFGLSGSNLNSPSFFETGGGANKMIPHIFLTGGYNFDLTDKIKLTPSLLWKTDTKNAGASSIDINVLAKYNNDKFWGGLSVRQGDALVAMVGLSLLKDNSLKVGYAFDLTISGNNVKAGTSSEVFITYAVPVKLPIPKPIIRTPRFRF